MPVNFKKNPCKPSGSSVWDKKKNPLVVRFTVWYSFEFRQMIVIFADIIIYLEMTLHFILKHYIL